MAKQQTGGYTVYTITATTDGSGAATVYSDDKVTGAVVGISYVKTDFSAGVDFAITGETTGAGLWTQADVNASATVYPIVASNLVSTGVAQTTLVPPVLFNERVKIAVTSGGATKTGTFYVSVKNV